MTFLSVLKKDLRRYFTDKRIIFTLLFPILIFFVFFFIAYFIFSSKSDISGDINAKIVVIDDYDNLKTEGKDYKKSFYTLVDNYEQHSKHSLDFDFIFFKQSDFLVDNKIDKDLVINKINELDALMALYIDSDLDKANLDVASTTPSVFFYFDLAGDAKSNFISSFFLNSFKGYLDENYPPKIIYDNKIDILTQDERILKALADFLPMIVVIAFVTAISSFVPSVIAEEKEKGILATILVTPCSRESVAFARICSTSLISLFSIGCSLIFSLILAVIGLSIVNPDLLHIFSLFSFLDYFSFIFTSIFLLLLFVALLMFATAFARTVKEANNYIAPFMIVVILVSYLSFLITKDMNIGFYFIPIFNSLVVIKDALFSSFNVLGFFIQLIVNGLLLAGVVFGIAKLFNNEKIMYNAI